MEIDSYIGCAVSGLTADARTMIEHARTEAQNHTFVYNEKMLVESVVQSVCDLALRFGEGADGQEPTLVNKFNLYSSFNLCSFKMFYLKFLLS